MSVAKKLFLLALVLALHCLPAITHAETHATALPSPIKDPAALLDNQIAGLDTLIQATQQSLEGQKQLRTLIVEYKNIQTAYLKRMQDNDLLLTLVKSAHRTLKAIKENHLLPDFDPEFIDELTVLSQAATKRGVPKP